MLNKSRAQNLLLTGQCPKKTYRGNKLPKDFQPVVPRSLMFGRILQEVTLKIRKDHGKGQGWAEGMTRKNARRIMLRLARRTFRNMRDTMLANEAKKKETQHGEHSEPVTG